MTRKHRCRLQLAASEPVAYRLVYLGAEIHSTGSSEPEVRRRIGVAKSCFNLLNSGNGRPLIVPRHLVSLPVSRPLRIVNRCDFSPIRWLAIPGRYTVFYNMSHIWRNNTTIVVLLVFRVNKLVWKTIHFVLESLGKVRENEFSVEFIFPDFSQTFVFPD